jgi:rubrerythrin
MKEDDLFQTFKVAIDNEYQAYQMYTEIAEKSEDSELGVIFRRMAKEEWEHMDTIMKRYKMLRNYEDTQVPPPSIHEVA